MPKILNLTTLVVLTLIAAVSVTTMFNTVEAAPSSSSLGTGGGQYLSALTKSGVEQYVGKRVENLQMIKDSEATKVFACYKGQIPPINNVSSDEFLGKFREISEKTNKNDFSALHAALCAIVGKYEKGRTDY